MNTRKKILVTTALLSVASVLMVANIGIADQKNKAQGQCTCQNQNVVSTDTMSKTLNEGRAYINAYNVPSTGLALEGYSPVSYFTEGVAQMGDPRFTADHNGVTYYFTSSKQVADFKADPSRFEPQYGGWCALGMAISDKLPVDPRLYKIVDGKLYLFLKNANIDALEIWNQKDESQLIKKGDDFWAKVSG